MGLFRWLCIAFMVASAMVGGNASFAAADLEVQTEIFYCGAPSSAVIQQEPFDYQVLVRNIGPDDATDVIITPQIPDTFPIETRFVVVPPMGLLDDDSPHAGPYFIPVIQAGATATISIHLRPEAAGSFRLAASVHSATVDPALSNNAAGNDLLITPRKQYDLATYIHVSNPEPLLGEYVTFTVACGNAGPDEAPQSVVELIGPLNSPHWEFVSCSPNVVSYYNGFGLAIPHRISPAQVVIGTVTLKATQPGLKPLRVSCYPVEQGFTDLESSNDRATATVSVGETTMISDCNDSPDLVPSISAAYSKGKYNKKKDSWKYTVNGKLEIHNLGNACTPALSQVRIYLSDDPVLSPDDFLISTSKLPKLCPSRIKKISFKAKLPTHLNPTGKYVIATADPDNTIAECRKENNIAVFYNP